MPDPNETPGLDQFNWTGMNKELDEKVPVTDPVTPPADPATPPVEPTPTQDPTPEVTDPVTPKPKEKPSETTSTEVVDDPDAKTLYEDFRNLGIIKNLEFEEGTPVTQENLLELLQEDRQAEIDANIQQYFSELDPSLKSLIDYVQNGGNMNDYFVASQPQFDLKGDLKNVDYQKQVIRYYEKQLGSTDEEINDLITLLDTGNSTASRAAKYHGLLKTTFDSQVKQMEQEQTAKANAAAEQEKQFVTSIFNELKKDSVLGLKMSPKDRQDLIPYITNRNVTLENGYKMTDFQYKLQEALANPGKLVFIAQLIKDDFKLDKLVKNYTTEKTNIFRTRDKKQVTENRADEGGSSNPFPSLL
jgi:hypothetical protein